MTRSTIRPAVPAFASALAAMGAAGVLILLSGCSSAPATDDLKEDAAASAEEWQHDFDKCLQDAGVDIGEGIPVDPATGGISTEGDGGAMAKAMQDCTTKLGPAPAAMGAVSDEKLTSMMLDFAACMRAAGYDMPDPKPVDSSGGLAITQNTLQDADEADITKCNAEAGLDTMGAE